MSATRPADHRLGVERHHRFGHALGARRFGRARKAAERHPEAGPARGEAAPFIGAGNPQIALDEQLHGGAILEDPLLKEVDQAAPDPLQLDLRARLFARRLARKVTWHPSASPEGRPGVIAASPATAG